MGNAAAVPRHRDVLAAPAEPAISLPVPKGPFMSKRSRKRRSRKSKSANHGRKPNA